MGAVRRHVSDLGAAVPAHLHLGGVADAGHGGRGTDGDRGAAPPAPRPAPGIAAGRAAVLAVGRWRSARSRCRSRSSCWATPSRRCRPASPGCWWPPCRSSARWSPSCWATTTRLTRSRVLGLFLGLGGVALVVGAASGEGEVRLINVVEVLIVAVCYSIAPFITDRKLGEVPGIGLATLSLGAVAIVYLPIAAVVPGRRPDGPEPVRPDRPGRRVHGDRVRHLLRPDPRGRSRRRHRDHVHQPGRRPGPRPGGPGRDPVVRPARRPPDRPRRLLARRRPPHRRRPHPRPRTLTPAQFRVRRAELVELGDVVERGSAAARSSVEVRRPRRRSRAGAGRPSMWGQSEPKITRSAPISSTTSSTSSSQNGLIQTWRRNVSTGSSGNQPGILRADDAQLVEQAGQELGAVLDRRDPQVREAVEEAVADQRRRGSPRSARSSCSILIGWGDAAEVGGEAVGGVAVRRVAAVAGVDDDGDAGLVDPGPERVELAVGRASGARRRWWARPGA